MTVEIIKCFVASPSDTQIERNICDKVFDELNRSLGDRFGFRLESLKWEFDSYPSFNGEYSQKIISDQLGSNYQLFIGIMNQKFGTPTKVANSGTEEEFDIAYNKLMLEKNVEIMFYFNTEFSGNIDSINLDSIQQIRNFKSKLQLLNGYYWQYEGTSKFEEAFRNHIIKYLNKKFTTQKDPANQCTELSLREHLSRLFASRLEKALCTFNSQPIIWVEPVLSTTNEISENPDENYHHRVPVDSLLVKPKSTIIKAPRQFGLTSLGHYLVKKAWELNQLWIYLDAESLKPHTVHNAVNNELKIIGMPLSDVKCIILDSWYGNNTNSFKVLKNLIETHSNVPIYVLYTLDDSKFFNDDNDIAIDSEFDELHLLALPRNQIRKIVCEYNKAKIIGDENDILSKVVSDLDTLNIHRTPFNCMTLLKVSETNFDKSPVNRTAMLEMVLIVLFVTEDIPHYKSKPDLKDCEYILGRFCENLIRNDFYEFSRAAFISELKSFCASNYIELEVELVFDVLAGNNIVVNKGLNYEFKSSYWIFYFAAKRMHNDKDFRDFIFSSKKYIAFPEIVEFYTGIDRNRSDAIKIMLRDLSQTCDTVVAKVGITETINPLSLIQWRPTEEQIIKAQNEISDSIISSSLPEEIKDRHADKTYNQIRPYNQSIQAFFEEYSVENLMKNIKAAARALRNSDYVDSQMKIDLLEEIFRGWEQISIILFALSPVLASKGEAKIEGASFELAGNFGETYEERINHIIQVNATNVVGFFKDDLFSEKIGPLLYQKFEKEKNPLKKHQIALLFIFCRPKAWRKHIEDYIVSLPKNSFYLFDAVNALRAKYRYDFLTDHEAWEVEYLLKMGYAKHEWGAKKPTPHFINQIPKNFLPKRQDNGG